jgi:hypothetical protein
MVGFVPLLSNSPEREERGEDQNCENIGIPYIMVDENVGQTVHLNFT